MDGAKVKKKLVIPLIIVFLILTCSYIYLPYKSIITEYIFNILKPKFIVADNFSKVDNNKNGVADALDIVSGANNEVLNKTKYIKIGRAHV